MKKTVFSLLVALFVLFSAAGHAQEAGMEKPGVMKEGLVTVSATVEAIDMETRTVTLRGEGGNTVTLQVSEEARNLDQVEVGDVVEADYYESVLVYAKDAAGDLSAEAGIAAARTEKGEKPGMAISETITITAVVEAIDYGTRVITLKGPEGDTLTRRVDDRVQNLENVKQGDEVVIQLTTAFAITVREP